MSDQGMKSRHDFVNSLDTVPSPDALKELVNEKDASAAESIFYSIAKYMRENPMTFSSEVDVSEYFHTSKEEVVSLVAEAFAKSGWLLVVTEETYFLKAA